jgi:hypothetical protein
MRTVFFIAIVLLTVPMPAVAADAAVIGKGAKVLPKQDAVVKVGNTIVDPNDLSRPARTGCSARRGFSLLYAIHQQRHA